MLKISLSIALWLFEMLGVAAWVGLSEPQPSKTVSFRLAWMSPTPFKSEQMLRKLASFCGTMVCSNSRKKDKSPRVCSWEVVFGRSSRDGERRLFIAMSLLFLLSKRVGISTWDAEVGFVTRCLAWGFSSGSTGSRAAAPLLSLTCVFFFFFISTTFQRFWGVRCKILWGSGKRFDFFY